MKRLILLCALVTPITFGQIVYAPNTCAAPYQIFDGINPQPAVSGYVFSNAASLPGNEPGFSSASCGFGGNPGSRDVFFTYTATASGTIAFQTCTPPGFTAGTLSNTQVTVHDTSCPGTLTNLACNDDSCGLLSSASLSVVSGTTYFVRVAGYVGATGTFYLTVTPAQPPPANDACANAIPITDGLTTSTCVGAATEAGLPAACATFTSDVWFSYTNPSSTCPASVTIDMCTVTTNAFDSVLVVWTGTCGSLTQLACNDDFCAASGAPSHVVFALTPGQTVLISVGAWSNSQAYPFAMNVTHHTAVTQVVGTSCPNSGISFSTTLPVLGQTSTISLTGATPSVFGSMFVSLPTPAYTPIGACNVYVDVFTMFELLQFATDTAGALTLTVPLPNDPLLECASVHLQCVDFGGSAGFELSNGVLVTLGF